MQQKPSALIELRAALPAWGLGRTSFYSRVKPESADFDPACPRGVQLSDSPNAKVFFTAVEVAEYQQVLLDRARARAADRAAAAKAQGDRLVTARRTARTARTGE